MRPFRHRTTPPCPPSGKRGRNGAAWVLLVLMVSFGVYAPSLSNDFTWDDRWAAMGVHQGNPNPLVSELHRIEVYFSNHYWPAKTPVSHTYRPVTVLTFALRYALVGDDPMVAHLLNVLLHTLAVWLCYLMLTRLGVGWRAACTGALVFGLHAVRSEAVANVVGRAELLAFCAGAGALLLVCRAEHRDGWRRLPCGVGAAVLLFLAFHSKENALGWVALLPLWIGAARVRRGHRALGSARAVLSLAATVAVPAAAYLWMRHRVLSSLPGTVDPSIGHMENPLLLASSFERVWTGVLAWGRGLWLTVAPFDLHVDYGPYVLPMVSSTAEPAFWGAVAVATLMAALVVVGVLQVRRRPLLFLAMAAFVGFSFAITNIPFSVFMVFAERTYYTPSLALTLLVVWVVEAAARQGPAPGGTTSGEPRPLLQTARPLLAAALGVWLCASVVVILQRNSVWRNNEALVLAESTSNPNSLRTQLSAGALWRARGDLARAEQHFLRATEIDPRSGDAWLQLTHVSILRGKPAQAERAATNFRSSRPDDVEALTPYLELLEREHGMRRPR